MLCDIYHSYPQTAFYPSPFTYLTICFVLGILAFGQRRLIPVISQNHNQRKKEKRVYAKPHVRASISKRRPLPHHDNSPCRRWHRRRRRRKSSQEVEETPREQAQQIYAHTAWGGGWMPSLTAFLFWRELCTILVQGLYFYTLTKYHFCSINKDG